MSLVSFVKASRNSKSVKKAIIESLNLINYTFSEDIRNVVIKPNMCYYWDYSTGQTTDPEFVAALIDVLREKISRDIEISIVESDASAMRCSYSFKFLGYEKMSREKDVRLVNLSQEKGILVTAEVEKQIFTFQMSKIIQNAELRINVPKIKYHQLTKMTCALKNIYGCNPYPNKYKYHSRINQVIVALNKIMSFDLCILDGIIAYGGSPWYLGLVMASRDSVAFDAAACEIMRINPTSVRHIMLAYKERLGNLLFIPQGTPPNYFSERFPKEKISSKILQIGYKAVTMLGLEGRLGLS